VLAVNQEKLMQDPSYGLTRHLPALGYDAAIQTITEALKTQGFGVLTEIDVKATLKKKIDADFRKYVILGACNPHLAHKALEAEPMIGLLLPCNVVVAEEGDGSVVSMISPAAMFSVVNREDLAPLVREVEQKLQAALDQL